jgi:HAD superfamily hydrolase (TIGR01484 family)
MIKAAFFDVDGTLLSHRTKQVPQSARDALDALKAAGIRCVVSTGRMIQEMDKLPMGGVTFDGYITMNGQLTMDENRQALYGMPLTGEVLEYALKLFRERKVPVIFVERDRLYVNGESQRVTDVQTSISSKVPPVGIYEGAPLYQACVYVTGEEERILDPIRDDCVITRWHPGGVDLIAKGGGKRSAILRLLEKMEILPEELSEFPYSTFPIYDGGN